MRDTHFGHILHIEEGFAEDGGNDHEERELCEALFLVAEEETGGDGGARTREARQHGEGLGDTDDEGVQGRDVLALARLGPVAESQQGSGDQQADAHHEEAATEDGLDLVLEQQAHDGYGDHGDEDVDGITHSLVPFPLEDVGENPHDFLPKDDDGAEYRSHMDGDGEGEVLFATHAEEVGSDGQMTAGGDGKIFGESLDDAQDERLQPIHSEDYLVIVSCFCT